jgi:hypothetical protein
MTLPAENAEFYPRITRITRILHGIGTPSAGPDTVGGSRFTHSSLTRARLRRAAGRLHPRTSTAWPVGDVDDDPLVLEARRAEIQQQAAPAPGETQVVDQLRGFVRPNRVQRLQLHQHLVVADEIDGVGEGQNPIPIPDGQPRFADERDATFLELDRERLAAHRFEETASELSMNHHSRADDAIGLRIVEI